MSFMRCVKTTRWLTLNVIFNAHHHSFSCLPKAKYVLGARINSD